MLTINASIGTETQGILLHQTLVDDLAGSLNDAEKVALVTEGIKGLLAAKLQGLAAGVSFQQALDYVETHTTIQT